MKDKELKLECLKIANQFIIHGQSEKDLIKIAKEIYDFISS